MLRLIEGTYAAVPPSFDFFLTFPVVLQGGEMDREFGVWVRLRVLGGSLHWDCGLNGALCGDWIGQLNNELYTKVT